MLVFGSAARRPTLALAVAAAVAASLFATVAVAWGRLARRRIAIRVFFPFRELAGR
jgi:hypothetical protein